MDWFERLKIGGRLTVGFAVMTGIIVVVGLSSLFTSHALDGSVRTITERRMPALTALLQKAASGPAAATFQQSLGLAGVDGTVQRMRDRNGNAEALGRAWLKTGSLRDVASVAGYVTGRSGGRYSLVVIVNHENASAVRAALDQLVEWTARQP